MVAIGVRSALALAPAACRKKGAVSTDLMPSAATLLPTPAERQVSPQVAAALLAKFRIDLAPQQEEVVDTFTAPVQDWQ